MVIITVLKTKSNRHVQPIESKIGPGTGQVKTEKTGKIIIKKKKKGSRIGLNWKLTCFLIL